MKKHKLVIGISAEFDKNYIVSSAEKAFTNGQKCILFLDKNEVQAKTSFFMYSYINKVVINEVENLSNVVLNEGKINIVTLDVTNSSDVEAVSNFASEIATQYNNAFIGFDGVPLKGEKIISEETAYIAIKNGNIISVQISIYDKKPTSAQMYWEIFTVVTPE